MPAATFYVMLRIAFVIPSIIALSRHFAHMKKENLVRSFWLVSPVVSDP